ncbi:MAG: alpha/beta hydrolase, partial [Deltaproteobacteria bacterium]|nr:alpha/beta hydrolase [Deltaproteobacteria bacterium]
LKQKDIDCKNEVIKNYLTNPIKPTHKIQYGPHNLQTLDVYTIKSPSLRPVIFFIHPGESTSFAVVPAVPSWLSLGYTVVSINYRYVPEYPFNEAINDCALALKWVTEKIQNYGGDPDNIAITGASCGAHLAALLVTGTRWQLKYNIDKAKVKCWIPMSGFYDLNLKENYLSPTIAEYIRLISSPSKQLASPVDQVTGIEPPSLIIHGRDDWAVPRTNAVALYNELQQKGAKAELALLKNYRHTNIFYDYYKPDHVPAILIKRFLATHLPSPENH